MKRSILTAFGICAVVLSATAVAFFAVPRSKPKNKVQEPQKTAHIGYVVRLEGDTVNVYEHTSEGETYQRSFGEINIFDLPDSVKLKLKEGVAIENDKKLVELIEDISS